LTDGIEDEPDSSASLFKQRFDAIDFTDEVNESYRTFSLMCAFVYYCLTYHFQFASEDEIEVDNHVSTLITAAPPTAVAMPVTTQPIVTLLDISQGITRLHPSCSTLTVGELQKLCQRPKELRLIYDFNSLLRTSNVNDSPSASASTAFLHYVIHMANQCLTAINDRQCQSEMKTTKKTNSKKQQTSRSKCYCSCCSHQHQLPTKEQRRPSAKATNSPNAEICALLQMPQSIPTQDMIMGNNDDISTLQGMTLYRIDRL
jgi:hypothetical protein